MTDGTPPPSYPWAPLVPELLVEDLAASLEFWCGLLGFRVVYARPEENFAYIDCGPVQVMLDQRSSHWETGPMERPFGRGINLQIETDGLAPILQALAEAGWPLYREPRESWYRSGTVEQGQCEFLVQDPDGYLLRFTEGLGERPAGSRVVASVP